MSVSSIFNPTKATMAVFGNGFSVPRMSTVDRLSLSFTDLDKGMMVYDTNLAALYLWNGSAWVSQSPAGPQILAGYGSPEGVVTAPPGSQYTDITDPLSPQNWIKGSGTGNTGWVG